MTFTPVYHQFTLWEYNQMRPTLKVPIKRITRARYEQALNELRAGKVKSMAEILSDVNDALERFDKRLTNKRDGLQK